MLRVTILGDQWNALRDPCEQSAPLEDGGFVLARPVETTSGVRLVVDQEVSLPSEIDRWNIQEESRLRPTTEYKSITMGASYQTNRVPIFIHNHPGGPSDFSPTDEKMHDAWLRDFVESSTQEAFGSLVFHENDVVGSVWTGTNYEADRHDVDIVNCCGERPIRSVRSLGDEALRNCLENSAVANKTLAETSPHKSSKDVNLEHQEMVDRQVQLIKRIGQKRLESARVAIVGLGGTGSATAVQCARLGIGSLLLIDPDNAEFSNLNRLYSLTREQARKEEPKTRVLKEHLKQTTHTDIEVAQDDVTSGNYDADLIDCDVILGCTDRHTPRAYLNELALLYGIPYIDVGTRATASNGIVQELLAEARHVVDGGPCLWCLDVLDSDEIRRESLSSESVEQEVEDGYLRGGGPEPSTILMTTMAATMGVTQTVAYLLNQKNVWDEKVMFYLWSCDLQWRPADRNKDCFCQTRLKSPKNDDIQDIF